uniref:Uncharacterized protein n=1 Tax=Brugia malayi TaxID=6279 RepID=A8NMD8_BRUMA
MFLDLCNIGNSVSAKTFLEIICEFGSGFDDPYIVSGKASGSYVECLQQIASKLSEKQYVLRKLFFLFDKDPGDSLLGTESILQYFFTYLCSNIMEPLDQELEFYPTNGKVWKDFLFSCCNDNTGDKYNDWILFIRLMSMLIKRSEPVWRAMKPRIFSKFPAKRFREMPIHSLICVFSLFISCLHNIDMEETSNKVISLATSAFDPSDKERHEVLIRAIQCTKYILDENRYDSSQAIATLIALMGKLDDKKDVSLYIECCICVAEKVSELAIKFERSQSAFQNMRQVVQNLLTEKSYKLEVCLYFLREFLRTANNAIYPVELIVPIWLVVAFEKPNTDGLFFRFSPSR